jgi:hypothetical protein
MLWIIAGHSGRHSEAPATKQQTLLQLFRFIALAFFD